MTKAWKAPVAWFALFNLLGAPFIGRAIWMLIQRLDADDAVAAAVALSVAGAVGILAINAWLTWWATRERLPRKGQMAMWLITGGTFVVTIGFGVFSPVNLVIALFRAAAM